MTTDSDIWLAAI